MLAKSYSQHCWGSAASGAVAPNATLVASAHPYAHHHHPQASFLPAQAGRFTANLSFALV